MRNLVNFFLQWLRLKPPVSQTTVAERDCLARHAFGKKKLVEIGVFQGVTTRILRQSMDPSGVIYAIDPFFRNRLGVCFYLLIALREVNAIKNGGVKWLEMTSAQALREDVFKKAGGLDFVFIDGDHTWGGIEGDWNGFSKLVVPGGIIALHDSRNRNGCGSELFTNEVILKDSRFNVVETEHSLTLLERL